MTAPAGADWFRHAIFYEVLLRSFRDSDSDGVGDLAGLTEKLDYLQWLGIDCVWLPPFFPSPLADGGYDISDYTGILPGLGDLDDFDALVAGLRERGMKIIIDFVMNHTSDQHPWFQASRHDPHGPFGDFYVWSDDNTLYGDARIIFLDTEVSNWTWDPVRKQYFWHRFFSHQPDLNYDNPAVMDKMLDALRFWLDRGVDGFRLDAVPYLVERPGTNGENLPETHAVLKRVRATIDAEYPGRILLCEANQWPREVVEYFGDGDECHLAFHFPIMPRMFYSLRTGDRTAMSQILADTPLIPHGCQWGTFLRNHDELTLEMVTPDDRQFMWREYAPEHRMRANLGIRRRLAPLLDNDPTKIRLMHALLLSIPGSPVLYYGDELGMGDNIWLPDRDGVRTPMQWNADPDAGFSAAAPEAWQYPLIADADYCPQRVNVEAEQADPTSLLNWLRDALRLRHATGVFGPGHFVDLGGSNLAVFAFLRYLEGKAVLCAFNMSAERQSSDLDLSWLAGAETRHVRTGATVESPTQEPYIVTLPPHGYTWIELTGFTQDPETLWWNHLSQTRWFGGKGRDGHVSAVRPLPWFTAHNGVVPSTWPAVRPELIDVDYPDGSSETYQVIASYRPFSSWGPAPRGVLNLPGFGPARVNSAEEDHEAQMEIARALSRRTVSRSPGWTLSCQLADDTPSLIDAQPVIFGGEQSNTSMFYGDVMVKLLRRPQPGHNPEVEALEALDGSDAVPRGYGHIAVESGDGTYLDLAIVSERIPDVEEGWQIALADAAARADSTGWATELGRKLAEVHATLKQAFGHTPLDGAAVAETMTQRLDDAIAAVPGLERFRDPLTATFGTLAGTRLDGQRLHGDFHLGQTLVSQGSWRIIDFEGEPLKSLAERTAPDAGWRDVAGMLRSIDYARASSPDAEAPEAQQWAEATSAAFLEGYAAGRGAPLTEPDRAAIRAYQADKATYEVVYEARNRPAWVEIPLRAIAQLVKENPHG